MRQLQVEQPEYIVSFDFLFPTDYDPRSNGKEVHHTNQKSAY